MLTATQRHLKNMAKAADLRDLAGSLRKAMDEVDAHDAVASLQVHVTPPRGRGTEHALNSIRHMRGALEGHRNISTGDADPGRMADMHEHVARAHHEVRTGERTTDTTRAANRPYSVGTWSTPEGRQAIHRWHAAEALKHLDAIHEHISPH